MNTIPEILAITNARESSDHAWALQALSHQRSPAERLVFALVFLAGAACPIVLSRMGTLDQEPWVHGPAHEAIRRRYIEARYRLMPYIYTLAEEASRTGVPLMRPLLSLIHI